MSTTDTTDNRDIGPPECMKTDDYSAAEPARRRLLKKDSFRLFASLPNLRSKRKQKESGKDNDDAVPVFIETPPSPTDSNGFIHLDNAAICEDEDKPVYRWAVLYENQRGYVVSIFPEADFCLLIGLVQLFSPLLTTLASLSFQLTLLHSLFLVHRTIPHYSPASPSLPILSPMEHGAGFPNLG
jgi:hypothetical protein